MVLGQSQRCAWYHWLMAQGDVQKENTIVWELKDGKNNKPHIKAEEQHKKIAVASARGGRINKW